MLIVFWKIMTRDVRDKPKAPCETRKLVPGESALVSQLIEIAGSPRPRHEFRT
jgi:hypothetical protein